MVTFLPTPIGNLQDITLNTLEVLQNSDILLCEDTRVCKKLITLLNERSLLPFKTYQYLPFHTHNQEDFLKATPKDFFLQSIAFLSDAGMPCISDPGVLLVRYLQENKIPFNVLGGISAVTLAVAFSGIVEKEFVFLGFLPHKIKERLEYLIGAFKNPYPIVLYESPHRLMESLELMVQIDSTREVFLAKELTKKYQQTFKDTLLNILTHFKETGGSALLKGEWVMVLKGCKSETQEKVLTQDALLTLDIPPKVKAKILAKLNGGSASEYYEKIIHEI